MALIKCPECGREVSDKALSCPNCGYPISQDPLEWAMDFETYPLVQASEQRETQPLGEKKSFERQNRLWSRRKEEKSTRCVDFCRHHEHVACAWHYK